MSTKGEDISMASMKWEKGAEEQLSQLPLPVRTIVRRKLEERVEAKGGQVVTVNDFKEAKERFQSMMSDKSETDLESMMPTDNRPGVEMVVVETCHNELSDCPNPLIKTADWKRALEEWARENGISEKLRKMLRADKVKYHNKLRISISGCPNGCSRPQIADVGLVGYICPEFTPADCSSCGSCAEACPDNAIRFDGELPWFDFEKCQGCKACQRICPGQCISSSEPAVRVMIGGRLGRHPHLADVVGEVHSTAEAIAILDAIVNDYIDNAVQGERFANYWARQGKEKMQ